MILQWEALAGRSGHEAGLALLERMYREQTGQPLPPILRTERGKPYFPRQDWHFSISHTKEAVFCCLARENVGLDAEPMGRAVDPRLAQRYCSREELTRLRAPEDLLKLWVLKESYAKLTGRGLGDWLKETQLDPRDPRVREIGGHYVALVTEERENAV